MIEQEKSVQYGVDIGTKLQSDRLSEIGLPSYARVLSCVGLPNIFAWQNDEKSESFQETWLYVPDSTLDTILESKSTSVINKDDYKHAADSIRLGNQTLYPMRNSGRVTCIVAVPEGKQFTASRDELEKLERMVNPAVQTENTNFTNVAHEFVSRLFNCKQSYAGFAQRFLKLLTEQVERSYAGLYSIGDDGYHRRWSYGSLQLSDKLPIDIPMETVEMWKVANSCGKAFIPADLVEDETAFLLVPPSYLFIHQTPDFGDRNQWLVMAVPGDISKVAIDRVTTIAGLIDVLDDERMTGYSELIEMFSGILNENHCALPLESALELSFKLIEGKLRTRSLCLLDTDNTVSKCVRINEDRLQIDKSKITHIPDRALRIIESREPGFFDGPVHPQNTEIERPVNGAISHAFFPVPIKEDGTALLSVEFSGGLERARHYQQLLGLVSKYLGVCISLTRSAAGELKVVGIPTAEFAETISLDRLQTLSKLNGGYFHELIEFISVILGQAEIMEHTIQKSNRPLSAENLLHSTDRIVRAAESLVRGLEQLKEVSTIKPIESGKTVTSDQFVRMLPSLTFGYYLTVKDIKNVEIDIQAKCDKSVSFAIPVLHIYDFILPLILTIMDEAICSGKIFVSVAEHFGLSVLRISYPKKLSGKLSLEKLLDKVFKYHQPQRGEKGELKISANDAQFVFTTCEGDRYQAIYSNTGHSQQVQEYA